LKSFKDWFLFIFICIIWGSSFILMKKGLIAFDAAEVASLRIGITALAFIPIYFLLGRNKFPMRKLKFAALAGLLGNGLPAFLYATAQTHVESSIAGILNSLTPIFVWVIGLLFFGAYFKMTQLAGVVTGFIGAALIVLLNHRFQLQLDAFTLLIVVATMCYGLSANIVKTHLQDVDAIALTAVSVFIIGVPVIIYTFFTDIYTSIVHSPQARYSLLALVVLALIGTALANILFYRLIQKTSAVFASSVAYLIPVTALIWGLLDGEALALVHFLGMALIMTGVYLLRR
jgi:drug/metabolite transporter (DMT)-like permease